MATAIGYNTLVFNQQVFVSQSPKETQLIAQQLTQKIKPVLSKQPIVISLHGELGTGKTQFIKGLASTLGYQKLVTSPSYTLVNEYPLLDHNLTLYHLDAWRLNNPLQDLPSLGWKNFIIQPNIIALEWPPQELSSWQKLLPPNGWTIDYHFEYLPAENHRHITQTIQKNPESNV